MHSIWDSGKYRWWELPPAGYEPHGGAAGKLQAPAYLRASYARGALPPLWRRR